MTLRDDVLDRTDIVDLVSKYVDLKKVGKNWSGLCPFHRERSPSFTVAEDKQIFKCFGCGKGGNALTFHMEIERIDFWDSLQLLAKDANIDVSSYQKDPEKQQAKKSEREKIKLLNKRVQQFFQQHLDGSVAQAYILEKRGLSRETIDFFGLGYAPDSYNDLLMIMRDKGFSNQDMLSAGVVKAKNEGGDVYSFFRHRLTFPIHDHIGNVVGFGARALNPDQTPKYLNTTQTPVYEKSQVLYGLNLAKTKLKEFGCLIIVEGYMDVIALHQYGLPIGIATCGTALTKQHTKLIRRHTDQLVFAFDNDHAGFEAAIRGLKVAYEQDLYPQVLVFPDEYKDVDERLTAQGVQGGENYTSEIRKEKLQSLTQEGFQRILVKLQAQYDLDNPVERKKTLQLLFELLSKIEDYSILQMYFSKVVTMFGVSEQMLWKQFRQWIKKSSVRSSVYRDEEEEIRPDSSFKLQEKYLLAVLIKDSFATKLGLDQERFDEYYPVFEQLGVLFPSSVLSQVVDAGAKISGEVSEKLSEAELFREQELGDIGDDKKQGVLEQFLHTQVYKLQRVIMKSKKLSGEQKSELLKRIREL